MFEKFTKSCSARIPCVSGFYKSRRLCFNTSAINIYDLAKYKFCNLYFNKDEKKIGFEFTETEETYSAKVTNTRYGLSVPCGTFASYYMVDIDSIKKAKITKNDGMLIIGL